MVEPDNQVALVGVLRSAVFGVSDEELFRFVRLGGRFAFRGSTPDDAPDDDS